MNIMLPALLSEITKLEPKDGRKIGHMMAIKK